ncbi:hypothetical protein Enr13x_77730 [Stieleria neptunia]|uniref:EF-hand domain-containing protein n=1 Tax=Stieleria neptunia TaxID=2527979 RepID=A0A518I420_9BACT|nr:hypothetical protein [Stieleria neptunia]QDV47861.1 hypothetical protein Enr13x_77730 [Stieleria neptunia]
MHQSISCAAMSIALLFGSLLTGADHCGAQVLESAPTSEEATATTSVVDAVEKDYRELICARAADASDAYQDQAIDLALRQGYVDARFDAIVRQSMQNASYPEQWNVEELSRAIKLLPLCTLAPREQAELVFECYLECEDSKTDSRLRSQLKQVLRRYPDPTSRLVNERLRQTDDPKSVLPLVDIVGSSTEATLPRLMELAKSGDPEVAVYVMGWIPNLMEQVRKLNQRSRKLAEQKKLGVEGLDSRMVAYAKRIIGRYDTDGDQELTPEEYEKMLQSPAVADADENGRISIGEYAAWLQSRSRRQE